MASFGVLLGSLLCQVAPIYRGDDDADPARFLASREALWAMYGHSPRHWFTLLEHSVEGSALTFLETHFDRFGRTPALWTTFKEKFIARFRQDVSVADMWLAIARRTQGESESVVDFVTAMEHMLWRVSKKQRSALSEAEIASTIQARFRPNISKHLAAQRFASVDDLLTIARRFEESPRELERSTLYAVPSVLHVEAAPPSRQHSPPRRRHSSPRRASSPPPRAPSPPRRSTSLPQRAACFGPPPPWAFGHRPPPGFDPLPQYTDVPGYYLLGPPPWCPPWPAPWCPPWTAASCPPWTAPWCPSSPAPPCPPWPATWFCRRAAFSPLLMASAQARDVTCTFLVVPMFQSSSVPSAFLFGSLWCVACGRPSSSAGPSSHGMVSVSTTGPNR
ncbi:LIM domain-binding protein 3-like [Frankliniella occidentalis]|uniref:LIM domain-binding protein 3-like n=1 Tax=Frankliniella occidentalis TaxID=133901 RepID=A0A9C6X9F9_FRAOC|nr:LIM domain-binding protein 3-like [Frankliniella occidentalis]